MIGASILKDGTFKSGEFDEVSKTAFKIKKGTTAGIVETTELNEVDFVANFSIKKDGSILSKEFIEA